MKRHNHLRDWLTDPRTAKFFGRVFAIRADALALAIAGGSVTELAKKHGISRSKASRHVSRARRIFGLPKHVPQKGTSVDCST